MAGRTFCPECGLSFLYGRSYRCSMCEGEGEETPPTPESDPVNHPAHYGGKDNPYEAIKVIRAWELGFSLGSVLKYIARAEHKGATIEDLKKARWYLDEEIKAREKE